MLLSLWKAILFYDKPKHPDSNILMYLPWGIPPLAINGHFLVKLARGKKINLEDCENVAFCVVRTIDILLFRYRIIR